jgi:hypothetical protein
MKAASVIISLQTLSLYGLRWSHFNYQPPRISFPGAFKQPGSSQKPVTGAYSEPDKSRPHTYILLF